MLCNRSFHVELCNVKTMNFLAPYSKEDIKEYERAFSYHDKNRDGKINNKQLLHVMRAMGENPTEDDILQMLLTMDKTDASDLVTFDEFMQQMLLRKDCDDHRFLMLAFGVFDINGDGQIDGKEFRTAMTTLGNELTQEEVDDIMQSADVSKDGYIDYEEFAKMLIEELKDENKEF